MSNIESILVAALIIVLVGSLSSTVANQTTGQTTRPVLPVLQIIDSNALNDSGATMGFSGPYPASFSENGQCFQTPSSFAGQQLAAWNLRQVKFNMKNAAGSPVGVFQALLFASTGTMNNNCAATGSVLAASNTQTITTIGGDTPFFTFTAPSFQLVPGTIYAVSIRLVSCTLCNGTNYWLVEYSNTNFAINDNIYLWLGTTYSTFGPHQELRYEIDGDPVNPTPDNIRASPGFVTIILLFPMIFALLVIAGLLGLFPSRPTGL